MEFFFKILLYAVRFAAASFALYNEARKFEQSKEKK